MSNEPPCCAFCFNHDIPLFEGGFEPPVHICAFCANRALSEITPQSVPEPNPPPERPSKEARLASIPSPKSLDFPSRRALRMATTPVSNGGVLAPPGHTVDAAPVSTVVPPRVPSSERAEELIEKFRVLLSSPLAEGVARIVEESFRLLPIIPPPGSMDRPGYASSVEFEPPRRGRRKSSS